MLELILIIWALCLAFATIWWVLGACAASLDQGYLFCADVLGPVGDLWRALWSSKLGRILTTRIL